MDGDGGRGEHRHRISRHCLRLCTVHVAEHAKSPRCGQRTRSVDSTGQQVHPCDLRGEGTARPAGDHDRSHQYAQFAQGDAPDEIHGQRFRPELLQLDRALLVSRKAVMTDQDRRFVYVVDDNNQVVRRQVTPGRSVEDLLVIHQGLESGDRVIVNGIQKVFGDGMPVQPNQVAMRSANDEQPAIAVAQP